MKEKQIIFRIDENLKKQFQIKIRDEGLTMSEVLSSLIQKYIDCDDKLKIKQEKYKFSYISQNIVHIYVILNEVEFNGKSKVLDRLEELECLFLK